MSEKLEEKVFYFVGRLLICIGFRKELRQFGSSFLQVTKN